jgi:hypothetical protein
MTTRNIARTVRALIAGTLGLSACAGMSQQQKGCSNRALQQVRPLAERIGNQTGSTARGAIAAP